MEQLFKQLAGLIAVGVETAAALIIALGAAEAAFSVLRSFFPGQFKSGTRKEIWLGFAMWLILGLEFELAADVLRTAISPTWTDIGQLAAIGGIRTFLNYFLEKDLETYVVPKPLSPADNAPDAAEALP